MAKLHSRPPMRGEFEAIASLCLHSKAHWGYDASFLKACTAALQVNPDLVGLGLARVIEEDGRLLGYVQVDPCAADYGQPFEGDAELDLLFVAPNVMGRGVGRELLHFGMQAAERVGRDGLAILSDPGAQPFYEARGAVFVRDEPSDVIPGRTLPLLRLHAEGYLP